MNPKTREQLEAMDDESLMRTYAEVVGGGLYEDGHFKYLYLRNFSLMDNNNPNKPTVAERKEWIGEILEGKRKLVSMGEPIK